MVTIDLSQLRAVFGSAADGLISELLTSYLAEGRRDMAVLRLADGCADMQLLVRIVHNLKSSSATLGMEAFSALCREAEQHGRQGKREALQGALPRLVGEFELVLQEVEKLLQGMPPSGSGS
ncbi:MAG TPA: Hpt domain-containing protein [Macromonas sp.]|nr:Hpt domain-containing protein [Macromonas sp.]